MGHESLAGGAVERRAWQSLDGLDLAAVHITCEEATRAAGRRVDQDGAGATALHLARLLHAGQAKCLAKEVEQQLIGGNSPLERPSVDARGDLLGHGRPVGSASLTRRHQAIQYSSVNSSWYLVGNSSPTASCGIGTRSPRARATNCSCAARSRVIAARTAQRMSSPTTRIPWFRSKTALLGPRACATALPWSGEVTRPAVPSKTGTPSGNISPSWERIASPCSVAPTAIECSGWV